MKPKMASVLRTKVFVAVAMIAIPCALFATAYRSQKSGSWTATGDEGIWNIAGSYPNSTSDGVQIYAGHVVTLSADAVSKNLHLYGTLCQSSGTLESPNPGEAWKIYNGGLYELTGGYLNVRASGGLGFDSSANTANTLFRMSGDARVSVQYGINLDGGTFEVNGGSFASATSFKIPANSACSGRLLFNGVKMVQPFKSLYLATVSQKNACGTLAFSNATVAFTNAYNQWSMTSRQATNNTAVMEIDNSRVWFTGYDSTHPSLPLMTNGDVNNGSTFLVDVKNGSTLLVGGDFNSSSFEDDSIWSGFSLQKSNYNDLYIRNGATVKVDATSTLKVRRQLFGAAGGKLVIDGGTVECYYFGTEDHKTVAYTTPFRVEMKGGTLTATGDAALRIGGDAYSSTSRANMCPVVFEQTGGVVSSTTTKTIEIASGSANNVCRYAVSGGSIGANVSVSVASGYGELVFRGSVFDGRISGASGISTSGGLVEFVLDKSPSHITNVYVSEQKAYIGGHLRVALDGGVLLTEPTEFLLVEKKSGTGRDLTYNDSKSYASTPDGTLWSTALDGSKLKVTATMADALGTVSASGGTFAPESPAAVGSVQLTQLQPGQKLTVSMRVRDADGNEMSQDALDSLVAGLAAAGYTNSTADASASYNLTAVLPGDCVTATSERFAWDFTVNSVRDIATNGTTRVLAKVAGLKADTGKKGLVIYFH